MANSSMAVPLARRISSRAVRLAIPAKWSCQPAGIVRISCIYFLREVGKSTLNSAESRKRAVGAGRRVTDRPSTLRSPMSA